MKYLSFFIFCSASILSLQVSGEIYRWTDDNGKVHYGDRNTLSEGKDATEVKVRDKYKIPEITAKSPIPYVSEEEHRTLSLNNAKINFPNASIDEYRVGRVTCGKPIDLYWRDGNVDITSPESFSGLIQVLLQNGYSITNAIGSQPSPAHLSLEAELLDFKFNTCPSKIRSSLSQNATYLKIRWRLLEPLSGKLLYEGVTSGSSNQLDEPPVDQGALLSFTEAMKVAGINLIADESFVNSLTPVDIDSLVEDFGSVVNVSITYGSAFGKFSESVEELKANSAIVKTDQGHGSGVLISRNGYLLTNAHVVGKQSNVDVVFDKKTYRGLVIRNEPVRDVALLKIDIGSNELSGVPIARRKPTIGEDLYVIGAPLDISYNHTLTKGVVSAHRSMQGLNFIQTDAAINRGNSGGPVFNSKGELVALTVAGLFTRDGANISINYLIPIQDALSYLKINSTLASNETIRAITSMDEQISNGEELPAWKRYLLMVINWLDSPLI